MNKAHGDSHFISNKVEDLKMGYVGIELHRTRFGKNQRVARVVYWDADGQLAVETFGTDIPVSIMEVLIAEAKEILP